MINKKSLLWVTVAFIAGGVFAARQNIIEHQPMSVVSKKVPEVKSPPAPPKVVTSKEHDVTLILIAQLSKNSDAKDIGCDNTAKSMTRKSTFKGDPVQDALEVLFALNKAGYENGDLYNALYQSKLKVQSVETKNDVVTVKLTGNIKLSGECDIPRVREQLIGTVKVASNEKKAVVLVNGKKLDDVLSLQK
ncbi:MAG: GerMN domain-containing protein [Abditibacteriaceae bacterium]